MMHIAIGVLSLVWLVVSVYITLFFLWRILEREYVEHISEVVDSLVLSAIVAFLVGRVSYFLFHLDTYGFNLSQWVAFSTQGGFVQMPAVVAGLVSLSLLAQPHHDDALELTDFVSIAVVVFLCLGELGLFARNLFIVLILRPEAPNVFALFHLEALLSVLFYALFARFLLYLERVYRTFLWYRYRRSSAQSGFVTAAFCVGYGLWTLIIYGLETFVSQQSEPLPAALFALLVVLAGFVILYVRSGRFTLRRGGVQ